MIEVEHILDYMRRNKVNVLLSQEIRQELNIRDLPVPRTGKATTSRRISMASRSTLPFRLEVTVRSSPLPLQ